MVIGFDISTSITGVALIADGQLVYYDSIDLRKHKDEGWMMGASDYPIEHIYIEQSLHMFMRGKSSAKTLSTLTRFNGIASWLIYELFEIKPKFIGATSARKHAGIKIPRGQKAKQVVLEHLLDNEPSFKVEYTKHGNPKPDSFDKADAIVIAKAGWSIESNQDDA